MTLLATTTYVDSQQSFDRAHDNASVNDSIIWRSGTYSNIYMDISKDQLYISAETLGGTIFNGGSMVEITGDHITFQGFQFLGGNIGTDDVINIRGSHILFTQVNIQDYTCYKYLRVRESSQFVDITYCNFENRLNLDDQNILSILVHPTQPGFHKIQWCSFKNFDGTGRDLGIEPIRIGLSSQATRSSRSLVEYCYFTQCNGDGEIISSKAAENVYRYNTFEDNPLAELVLRHGSRAVVYGNFFLNGKGGVRVREGQEHYIYNNYFYDLDDRPIYLQNEASDPLSKIDIAFNTIINCEEVRLGGGGSNPPTEVTFANNIIADAKGSAFRETTGMETWIGNIVEGSLGMEQPAQGINNTPARLEQNSAGYYGLASDSPAIDAVEEGYKPLPQFEGMEEIDTALMLDLMGQQRPTITSEKDVGCNEYPHETLIQPIAMEANTGPSYLDAATTSTTYASITVNDLLQLHPNPVSNQLQLTITSQKKMHLQVVVFDMTGKQVATFLSDRNFIGDNKLTKSVAHLPTGVYVVRAHGRALHERVEYLQSLKFTKVE